MRTKKITFEEAREARKLLNMPGGLELHIGVSQLPRTLHPGLTSACGLQDPVLCRLGY